MEGKYVPIADLQTAYEADPTSEAGQLYAQIWQIPTLDAPKPDTQSMVFWFGPDVPGSIGDEEEGAPE
jgi:hypothetical protein